MSEKIVSSRERREVVCQDGVMEVRRVVTERMALADDVISQFNKTRATTVGPLPYNCVAHATGNAGPGSLKRSLYVVELTPHLRKVVFRRQAANAEEDRKPELCMEEYNLSWPYALWVFDFQGPGLAAVYLCAAKSSVRELGMDIPLFKMPIHNQYGGGDSNFCVGNLSMSMDMPEHIRVQEALYHLLTSMWNTELLPDFEGTGITSLGDWDALSKEDAEGAWKKIKFARHKFGSLRGLLNSLGYA